MSRVTTTISIEKSVESCENLRRSNDRPRIPGQKPSFYSESRMPLAAPHGSHYFAPKYRRGRKPSRGRLQSTKRYVNHIHISDVLMRPVVSPRNGRSYS